MNDYENYLIEALDLVAAWELPEEDLAAAVGASTNRDADGRWLPTFELARSLCLVAAAAAVPGMLIRMEL